jgi:DNA-binding transcriptional MerR regulator
VAEYRIDELAVAAETSVRNVRVYQERGLLPPPRRVGRTGVYSDAHLARLRLIRLLLHRGYTFATIGELIQAWSAGQGIADLLGLHDLVAAPWSDEKPEVRDEASLVAGFGDLSPHDVARAAALGFLVRLGDDIVAPSPRLLEAGAELVAAGVPLSAVLDLAENLKTHLDEVARQLFQVFDTHVAQEGRPSSDVAEALLRVRPFAREAVDALLSMALEGESRRVLERRAQRSTRPRSEHTA